MKKPIFSIQFKYSLLILLGCGLVLLFSGCGKQKQLAALQTGKRPPVPVTVASVTVQDVPFYLDSIGYCLASEVVDITPQVPGYLEGIHFQEGDCVQKGDLLFTIDAKIYENQYAKAQATLKGDLAALFLNQARYERSKPLAEEDFISPQDFEALQTEVIRAESALEIDEANVNLAKIHLDYCTICSPIDGVTSTYNVDVGNYVIPASAGSTSVLTTIHNIDTLFVDFTIPEKSFYLLKQYFHDNELPVEVSPVSNRQVKKWGSLFFIENTLQLSTGTIMARARVENTDHTLWPNESVSIRVTLETLKNAMLIPANAIQIGQKGHFVFTVDESNTTVINPVVIGQKHGDFIVIQEGLSQQSIVITQGQQLIGPGSSVAPIFANPNLSSISNHVSSSPSHSNVPPPSNTSNSKQNSPSNSNSNAHADAHSDSNAELNSNKA